MTPLRNSLREMLGRRQFKLIGEMATRRKRALGSLIALTCDPDPLTSWRAVEALGVAADHVAQHDPECVREHLRRLHWLLSDESGGVGWRAPEAIAEIVRRRPKAFGDYVPIVVFLLVNLAEEDLAHFKAGILWAIGRLGTLAAGHVPAVLASITSALDDADSQVRGMAVWCLGQVGCAPLLAGRPELITDKGAVELYEEASLKRTSVGELVRQAPVTRRSEPER